MPPVRGKQTEQKNNDDLSKRCRACMKNNFDVNNTFSQTVKELFEFCTGISMSKDDGLPVSVCKDCRVNLIISHKFKDTCLKSDQLFRKLLQVNDKITIKKEVKPDPDYIKQEVKTECITISDEDDDGGDRNEDDDDGDRYDDDDFFVNQCPEIELPQKKPKTKLKTTKTKKRKYKTKQKKSSKIKNVCIKIMEKKDGINGIKDETKEKKIRIKKLLCEKCDIKFLDKPALLEHVGNVHGFDYICDICGKQYINKCSYDCHIKSHIGPRYQCDSCDYSTWHKSDLFKHVKRHTGIKNFVCEYCTRGFYAKADLIDHIQINHTNAVRKKFQCTKCDKSFYAHDKLKRHVETTHDNIRRFHCDICLSGFARRCQYKTHLQKKHNIILPRIRPGRQTLKQYNMLLQNRYDLGCQEMEKPFERGEKDENF